MSRFDHSPWTFWDEADADDQAAQRVIQVGFRDRGSLLGENCFISSLAAVDCDSLTLGDRSYIAAGAYLTGDIHVGADCSINPYTVVRGRVTLGAGVRMGAHTSLLGFNHTMDDPDVPVFRQPLTSRGITVGDDVWIGSHVVVLDGIEVGERSVLAAGAVVTKDVPAGAVVGGNPARLLKWRVEPGDPLRARLADFGDLARKSAPAILERSWNGDAFTDRPGAAPTLRAQCDAIEIADLLTAEPPPQMPVERQRDRLQGGQDDATGAIGALDGSPASADDAAYHVLCVGYALDLLGSSLRHPVSLVQADRLLPFVADLPWIDRAWHAGHWVDGIGTSLLWRQRRGEDISSEAASLIGWLVTHADPTSGMWGEPGEGGLLQVVNGFYRASRGTFAQFAVPVPFPERVIDTVLAHLGDARYFTDDRQDACNVLDVAHPLWLTRASGHRSPEVLRAARSLLESALDRWHPGAGFAFAAGGEPGLQGTEMWLAIIWYLADVLGLSVDLGYRPRGVHRPEAASTLR